MVSDYMSRQKLTKETIQRLLKRARDYIVSYHMINTHEICFKMEDEKSEPAMLKVDKMRKMYATHRCTMDFDSKFIDSAVQAVIDLT